jgi:two-component system sensor histidine kinase MtrB
MTLSTPQQPARNAAAGSGSADGDAAAASSAGASVAGESPVADAVGGASVGGSSVIGAAAQVAAEDRDDRGGGRREQRHTRDIWWRRLTHSSRSLRLRVVVMTLVLSSVVMVLLGVVLQRQIRDGLLANKQSAAIAEIENAMATARVQLVGAETNPTKLRSQLARLVQDIGNPARVSDTGAQGSTAGVFDPVVAPLRPGASVASAVGPIDDVPLPLRAEVEGGNEAWQYTTVMRKNAAGVLAPVPALVVGGPVVIPRSGDAFGVYLIFLLTTEQKTLAVVQQTLLVGAAALALALGLIAFLVATAVLRPIRRASAVAARVAAGDLSERMPVRGAAELTSMASSFNGMAEAIRAQIRQLEEFGALQRRFTSDVSHELRTPLTTVRMAADTLHAGRDEFPPHLARATELMVDELDRFEDLLTDLLEISRYDAGMAELQAESVDVRTSVMDCVAAAGPVAATTGVRIITHLPDAEVRAEVDVRRVERILRNLLNNAVDHAEGGSIDVELAADEDALAIAVTDYGVGLKPGEAGLVFNRFWRADPSRQRRTGGTGLGLAIALEDARLHGGWLQAWGNPGRGARFRLTLPRVPGFMLSASPLPLRPPDDEAGDRDGVGGGGVGSVVGGGDPAANIVAGRGAYDAMRAGGPFVVGPGLGASVGAPAGPDAGARTGPDTGPHTGPEGGHG